MGKAGLVPEDFLSKSVNSFETIVLGVVRAKPDAKRSLAKS